MSVFSRLTNISKRFARKLLMRPAPTDTTENTVPPPEVPAVAIRAKVLPDWLPEWHELIQKDRELWEQMKSLSNRKVLIATVAGGHPVMTAIESLMAAALALRGVHVEILMCDGILPACLQCSTDQFPDMQEFLQDGPSTKLCKDCFEEGSAVYDRLEVPVRKLSEFLTQDDRSFCKSEAQKITCVGDLSALDQPGLTLGSAVGAATMRFFARADFEQEDTALQLMHRYAEAAYLAKLATQRLFASEKYDCVLMNHGAFVPHGIVKEMAEKLGSRTVIWNVATRATCLHVNHSESAYDLVTREPSAVWDTMRWSERAEAQLLDYLGSKWRGSQDWIYGMMHADSQTDVQSLANEFGIDLTKPTVLMLTNVVWDAALFYPTTAFENHTDWMVRTIRYFASRPDLNLVIRVHPAEKKMTMLSRQTAVEEISKFIPELPLNVKIVPPESKANTYALASFANAALIYGTTTGLELTSMGIPTVTAGDAFIRNKGISFDPKTADEYFGVLEKLPFAGRMSNEQLKRARMFAYHYYFRRSIPMQYVHSIEGWPPTAIRVQTLNDLLPGKDEALDMICNGIINAGELLYRAEEYAMADDAPTVLSPQPVR